MSRLFNTIQVKFKKRNKFDLSHESRLTTDFGRLTPILCEPVLPNDRFQISTNVRVQFAPMKFPVMQRFHCYIHYFFVPNRLLWDKWEEFITGGEDGLSEPDYPTLPVNVVSFPDGNQAKDYIGDRSLADYLGFPTMVGNIATFRDVQLDALPFKAYQLIYNEWYRDQNLSDPIELHTEQEGPLPDFDDDGATQFALMELRQRAWRKDYFTSALKDSQRGPDVTLPLVGDMQIEGEGQIPLTVNGIQNPSNPNTTIPVGVENVNTPGGNIRGGVVIQSTIRPNPAVFTGNVNAEVVANHLSNSTHEIRSATINEVRRAFAIQRWYELAARAGSRYIEQIFAHFGIRSSDARLQRPEYLGGSVVPVFIGDVLQTSETGDTPLGTPAGVGQAAGRMKRVRRTFEEHGWILGIMSIIPDASYFQGMPRKFLKRDKFDFAWPLLANLGEQEIEKQELYFDPRSDPELRKSGFGYTPRYAEYKYAAGQVHGDFRGNLKDFHDARIFNSMPRLNSEFMEVRTPHQDEDTNSGLNRIFSVTSGMVDHLWVYLYNDVRVRRVLPKYGTPI